MSEHTQTFWPPTNCAVFHQEAWQKLFDRILSPQLRKQIDDLSLHFNEWNAALDNNFEKIAEGFRCIEKHLPNYVLVLASNGWFISSWYTPLAGLRSIADFFTSGSTEQGHELMCQHFSGIFHMVVDEISARHPERAVIIGKAMAAHQRGDYELSVPVFLAQAEGILNGVLRTSVYSRLAKKRETMQGAIEQLKLNIFEENMLRLVLTDLPITLSTTSVDYVSSSLSRHAIIHGLDVTYGTRTNSLRAFSWLQYASHFKEAAERSEDLGNEFQRGH